jgi:dipeptidyl aminopeptidase/acylaminoacyl peptidase
METVMRKNRAFAGATALALLTALAAAAQTPPSPVPLDQKAADGFAGYYQVNPHGAMRFYREDGHFYFNTVGTAQKAETVPVASNKFTYQNGAVVITFTPGADGKVNAVSVSVGGRDVVMPRITEEAANALAAAAKAPPPPVARTWPVLNLTPRPLTRMPAGSNDYWPCFSPDGKTVLFSRSPDGGKTWSLYSVPAAGGTAAPFGQVPAGLNATRASWSAAGNRIAFNGDSAKGGGIWVMDGDGRNAHAVATEGFLAPSYPSWYPDGVTIGFGDGARNILYRVDTRGGMPVAVTRQEQVLTGMSSVSPDGKSQAFAGQKNNGQLYDQGANQIWLVDDKGEAHPVEALPGQGRTPSWSPDGKRIAFESGRGSPDGKTYAIFIINRDGTGLTQVTDYALNGNHPVWSQDGKRLIFSYGVPGQENGIAVVDLPD